MKTKIDMAHDYAMLHMMMDRYKDVDDLEVVQWANDYVDALEADANKREKAEAEIKRAEMRKLLNADNTFVEKEGQHFDDVNFEPDWSQAPDGYNRFVVGSDHGIGFFTDIEPELIDQEYFYVGHNAKVVDNHNYQGDWKDSLRKRP